MKEKLLIHQGDPCDIPLDDPAVQTVTDAQAKGQKRCRFYCARELCSPPRFCCIRMVGLKLAQHVLNIYSEATEKPWPRRLRSFVGPGPCHQNG